MDVSFLSIDHTHRNVDQSFSCTSNWLRSNDAINLSDLHTQLRQTIGGREKVVHMGSMINCSGLCTIEHCLRSNPPLSEYRYFSINGHDFDNRTNAMASDPYKFKIYASDEWLWIHQCKPEEGNGFLLLVPSLHNTPEMNLCVLQGGWRLKSGLDLKKRELNIAKDVGLIQAR